MKKDWKKWVGSVGWFNPKGRFELLTKVRAYKASTDHSPIWTIVGTSPRHVLISVDMINVAQCPKKYINIYQND